MTVLASATFRTPIPSDRPRLARHARKYLKA
jgi:hypothetical protein